MPAKIAAKTKRSSQSKTLARAKPLKLIKPKKAKKISTQPSDKSKLVKQIKPLGKAKASAASKEVAKLSAGRGKNIVPKKAAQPSEKNKLKSTSSKAMPLKEKSSKVIVSKVVPIKPEVKKASAAKLTSKNEQAKNTNLKKASGSAKRPVDKAVFSADKFKITNLNQVLEPSLEVLGIKPYQQNKSEEYMSTAMYDHFYKILMAHRQLLLEGGDKIVRHMQEDAVNYADPNDRASQEEDFRLELRTRDRERKLLKKIEESLELLREKEYGYCEVCGVEIGLPRLEARPTATLCIDCKTLDEIKERQQRQDDDY